MNPTLVSEISHCRRYAPYPELCPCSPIILTRKINIIIPNNYVLHNAILKRTNNVTYLGVEITSKLTIAAHISKMCAKANRNLSFI